MNIKDRQKLYKKVEAYRQKNLKTFAPHGYIRDNYPKLLPKLKAKFGVDLVKAIHLYQYLQPNARTTCVVCKAPTKFRTFGAGFYQTCSAACNQRNPDVIAKKVATNLKRHGTEWPSQRKDVRKKVEATNLKKFGVKYPAQSKKIIKKMEATNLKKFGVKNVSQVESVKQRKIATNLKRSDGKYRAPFQNPDTIAKIQASMVERFGVAHAKHSPEIQEKVKRTNLRRYSVENPTQNASILRKAQKTAHQSYLAKISGKNFRIQGYEDIVIRKLVAWKVPVEKISAKAKTFDYRLQSKAHTYHPDLRITHNGQKLYVEVKSAYTAGLNDAEVFKRVLAKGKAVVKAGHPFLLLVVRPNKDSSKIKGRREGYISHFILSTPNKPDWSIHTKRKEVKKMKAKVINWTDS